MAAVWRYPSDVLMAVPGLTAGLEASYLQEERLFVSTAMRAGEVPWSCSVRSVAESAIAGSTVREMLCFCER